MSYFQYYDKNIYYSVIGKGIPLMLLHGNTASSKMFTFLLDLYKNDFQIILIDFLGNGLSERIDKFPENIWIDQGYQIIALANHLNIDNINLLGTSGGAYAAINAALEAPERFHKVIADSFDGRTLPSGFAEEMCIRDSIKARAIFLILLSFKIIATFTMNIYNNFFQMSSPHFRFLITFNVPYSNQKVHLHNLLHNTLYSCVLFL